MVGSALEVVVRFSFVIEIYFNSYNKSATGICMANPWCWK